MVRNSTNFSAFLDFTMTSENREIFTDFVEEKILLVKDNKRLTVMKFCGEEEAEALDIENCGNCTKSSVQFCFEDSCSDELFALQRLNEKLFVTFDPR